MSDGNGTPPARSNDTHRSEQSHRAEARRFLGTHMQQSMIRGLADEERARAWLGIANEKYQDGEIGKGIVKNIAERVRYATQTANE